jgi:sugar lactone lactonase YvrE
MSGLSDIVDGEVEKVAADFEFTEGPLWHPQGFWLFVDTWPNFVYKMVPGGKPELYREESGRSNGLTFDLQGRLLMCEGYGRRISRMEADGTITTIMDNYEGMRLNRPNDLVCHSSGAIYFTDPQSRLEEEYRELPSSMAFRIAPDGTASVFETGMAIINGLAFSADERTLYVINTREPKQIIAFDADADGNLSNRHTFIDMTDDPSEGNPDGMKVDVDGTIFSSGPGGIWVVDASGKHLGTISVPEFPSNCAFGDDDYRTLLITARTSVYQVRLKRPGVVPPGARSLMG